MILYTSREGSTAIINALSGQAGIHVPLVEELDWYRFEKDHKFNDIYNTLDQVFHTGEYSEIDNSTNLLQNTPPQDRQSLGFKWRIFGNTKRIAKIFREHNVTVYILTRRNLLEHVASSYIHKYGNDLQSDVDMPLYPQFAVAGMPEAEREAYLKRLRAPKFKLEYWNFLKLAMRRIQGKARHTKRALKLSLRGVRIQPMYYEDFDEDREAFIKGFLDQIGMEPPREINTHCDYNKVHDASHANRITGLNEVIASPVRGLPFHVLNLIYKFFVFLIAAISKT